ncbi:hypothetical protein [Bathymodiolus platifrons methanotrophic gill symbiont]
MISCQKLSQFFRNITTITKQLPDHFFSQVGNRFSVINITFSD